jgi:DNA modification methylase
MLIKAGLSEGLTDEDAVPEPPVEPVTVLGDLWLLGSHRVLCGDSTTVDAVSGLLGGDKADMVFTDPPYGVGYDGGMKKHEKLANDQAGTDIYALALPVLLMAAADHAPLYLWYAEAHVAAAAAAAAGYIITDQVIWVKNNAQFMSSAHYHGKHEPCFYAHRKGKSAAWFGGTNEVTVWPCGRAQVNEFHPTQKPVELAERAIGNSSKGGDLVLDLFGGSGSTLIACEKTGRRARLLEIAPQYVDVIVARWQAFTGKQATLDGDGRTFEELKAERIVSKAAA